MALPIDYIPLQDHCFLPFLFIKSLFYFQLFYASYFLLLLLIFFPLGICLTGFYQFAHNLMYHSSPAVPITQRQRHEVTLKLCYLSSRVLILEGSNSRTCWSGPNTMAHWSPRWYYHHVQMVAGVCWGHSLSLHGCQCHQQYCGAEFGYAGCCSRGLAGYDEWYSGQRLHVRAGRNFENGNVQYTIVGNK